MRATHGLPSIKIRTSTTGRPTSSVTSGTSVGASASSFSTRAMHSRRRAALQTSRVQRSIDSLAWCRSPIFTSRWPRMYELAQTGFSFASLRGAAAQMTIAIVHTPMRNVFPGAFGT